MVDKNIASSLYNAIRKSFFSKMAIYVVQFVALAVYARMFTPEVFGIIASIQVFLIFFQMLSDVGIGPALINEENITNSERDGIFTVTFIIGSILALVFYLCSYLLTYLYSGYEYENLGAIIGLSVFFSTISIVPVTSYNKDVRFVSIAKITLITEMATMAIVMFLYSLDFGLFALASRTLCQSILRFILSWFGSKTTSLGRAKLGKEIYHIKKIYGFALYQFLFNLVNYFSRNLDTILIGKYIGIIQLGLYDKAYQLMRYPLMLTTYAMTPAIQPILTKHSSNVINIVNEHNSLSKKLIALSVPISIFIYFNANDVVGFLFGSQWVGVVPIVEIFSFIIPIQSIMSTSGSFFQVMNNTRLLFYTGLISGFFNIIAIILGILSNSLELIASYLIISFSICFIQSYFVLFKMVFKTSMVVFYKALMEGLLSVIMPILLYVAISMFIGDIYEASSFFAGLMVNGTIFVLSFSLFSKKILNSHR